jgi:altronate dehydratase small subunit
MAIPQPSAGTDPRLLRIAPEDNVCVAATTIEPGQSLLIDGLTVTIAERIPTGFKVAAVPIAAGAKVLKYGAPIGSATRPIAPGELVHTHNVKSDYLPTFARGGQNTHSG